MKRAIKIYTGCSGYYNRHWKPVFYPEKLPQSKWFDHYCEQFNTVELNSTFYKFPTAKSLHTWYKKAPDDFLFSVKAPKLITHFKKFNDCQQQIDDFYLACEQGLVEKLGCVLFQLPPQIQYSSEKLQQLINNLRPGFKNVIEFRHKSWWSKKIYDELTKNKIIFCSISHPSLPATILANMPTLYLRLHGDEKMFYSGYSKERLRTMQQSIFKKKNVKEAFVYFNNTAGMEGVMNAKEFQRLTPNSTQ